MFFAIYFEPSAENPSVLSFNNESEVREFIVKFYSRYRTIPNF